MENLFYMKMPVHKNVAHSTYHTTYIPKQVTEAKSTMIAIYKKKINKNSLDDKESGCTNISK